MFKRFVCVALCLLLLCCTVLRPPAVHASAGGLAAAIGTTIGIPAPLAVGVALVGLGLLAKETGAFDSICTTISNGLDSAYSYISDTGEKFVTMLQVGGEVFANSDFLSYVQGKIFSSSILNTSYNFTSSYGSISSTAPKFGRTYPYVYAWKLGSTVMFSCFTTDPFISQEYFNAQGKPYISLRSDGTSDWSTGFGIPFTVSKSECVPASMSLNYVPKSSSFTVGNLAEKLDDAAYKEWSDTKIIEFPSPSGPDQDPDENPKPNYAPWWYPFGIPHETPDFPNLTQQEVQLGGKPGTGIQVDTSQSTQIKLDPDSLPDSLKPGANPSPDGSTNVNPETMKRDFTQVFPFCIPFDLYRLLHALVADPVAPEFDVSFPYPGGVYEDTIDLSTWDEVAAMVRKFEVAIFCVGLVLLTGKVIRW